ncbi:hypothetical protein EN866_33830 [Mesorhizobium sp. M2D.F.Ca.ET.223.01.1.1]|uniref:hypothetical protein n=1 Tax=Mesorhizobium sp. M2D.F.Ca.ET.223.01.1.1 TaxID=2563940 RepID=UPI001092DF7E|nr:hypothetical protein [Mesorhizobium sp. M2D.F.Ca.ET.223.01.1.1]TGR83608.1 hypothetical protein EN866_33830 [Mesorhizobium sp. M2D.F.Ca.ET.223.01.1.1]TGT74568.1 hypothetical protein EN802_12035 [bacterium M00.F.Ca.ET.159.01.1.1]TGT86818.1 hypothetical protein EN800_08925 [bacterium M00.F.Ca.ET.157.01.1.1]
MAQLGDIVEAPFNGRARVRWVVSGFTDRAGINCAQLIRSYGSGFSRYTKNVDGLTFVERPVFTPGQPVTVDGVKAVFMSRDGTRARIMLRPQHWVIGDNELMDVGPAVAALSFATLVLENRWKEHEGD